MAYTSGYCGDSSSAMGGWYKKQAAITRITRMRRKATDYTESISCAPRSAAALRAAPNFLSV
jgi:hypothetical protein